MLLNVRLFRPTRWFYVGLVLCSLAFTFLHAPLIAGTSVGLVVTVLAQLVLPGFLLARAAGKLRFAHPFTQISWVTACGLGIVICLGGAARLFAVPIPVYLLALHSVMLVLVLVPPRPALPVDEAWHFERKHIPLYLLVIICSLITLGVSVERNQVRFSGFEDQTVFVAQANWLANDPDDPMLRSQIVGYTSNDTRMDTDGWTYNHAAWAWVSGVSSADIIWFGLTALFSWLVPIATFALVYEASGRETLAAWSAAGALLAGLMTLEGLIYTPTSLAFGSAAMFQFNTLRTFSTSLVLPLGIFVALSYLRHLRRFDLLLVFLIGLALAILHPRQVLVFQVSIGAAAGVWFLAKISKARFIQSLLLLITLAALLILPFIQRQNRPGATTRTEALLSADEAVLEFREFRLITLENLPILGKTLIVDPQPIFYHPIIALSVLLGILAWPRWRRGLTEQYLIASTAIVLILLFVPGISAFYLRIVTFAAIWGTIFALPIGLALGYGFEVLLSVVKRLVKLPDFEIGAGAVVCGAALLLMVFEPIPITASARDRIRAANEMQILRNMRPSDQLMIEGLAKILPTTGRSILLSPNSNANFIIESIPHTLITGGRLSDSYAGTERFYTESAPPAPWLDSSDIAFMKLFGVTHIVIEADDTRLPQLLLRPDDFPYLGSAAGYSFFGVLDTLQPTPIDDLFERMNELYSQLEKPRWGANGFDLSVPASDVGWASITAQWSRLSQAQPENKQIALGLAFSRMMAGDDEDALPYWEQLQQENPQVWLYTDALANTQTTLSDPQSGANILSDSISGDGPVAGVLAANELLTEAFFYRLSSDQLDQIIQLADRESVLWNEFAVADRPDAIRQRVSLLMNVGRWDTAERWLSQVDAVSQAPQDLVALAALKLVQGDVQGALNGLQPAIDADWRKSRTMLHADRWANNTAAQVYYLLQGEIEFRAAHWDAAAINFRQAVDAGSTLAGNYFLAQALDAQGDVAVAEQAQNDYDTLWRETYNTPPPELVSLLSLTDNHALYIAQPGVTRDSSESDVTVWATYGTGKPFGNESLPLKNWLVKLISPDSSVVYGQADIPTIPIDGALLRLPVTLHVEDELEPLTPALVYMQGVNNSAVTTNAEIVKLVLKRPPSAEIPAGATTANLIFGDDITLLNYTVVQKPEGLEVTLYWKTDKPLSEDYQEFVHLVDDSGVAVFQLDNMPVNNRYPTSQWRTDTVIEDQFFVPLGSGTAAGKYQVLIGLYRLGDLTRLPITPASTRTENDSFLVYAFETSSGQIRPIELLN